MMRIGSGFILLCVALGLASCALKGSGANLIYKEEFAAVPDGQVPVGWLCGEGTAVFSYYPLPFWKTTELRGSEGSHRLLIPLPLPENFLVAWSCRYDRPKGSSPFVFRTRIDKVMLTEQQAFLKDEVYFNQTRTEFTRRPAQGMGDISWAIAKIGNVFYLYVNGKEIAVVRVEDFQMPESILLEFSSSFRLYNLSVYDLTQPK
jgi:hypothetical protein